MKFPLIKSTLFAVIITLTAFACSPDESNNVSVGTIKAKIGTESFESIGAAATILIDTLGQTETLTMTGGNLQFDNLSIILGAETLDIIKKTYTENGDVGDCKPENGDLCVGLKYIKLSASEEWGNYNSDSEAKVTVTAVDYRAGGSIQGTFEGKLYNPSSQESIDLTDGVFNLKIVE